jgi:putative DNA primase/helicase
VIDVDDVDPMPENDDRAPEDERSPADTRPDDDADSQQGDGDDAPQDQEDDTIEPLPGLPHEDYGREFDAPPPSAPLAVAGRIDRLFRADGPRTLLAWRGGFMRWDKTHWSELDPAQLRSHMYRSLSKATYVHVTANGAETKPWSPDRRKVANVMEALGALAHFSADIDPPSWVTYSAADTAAAQMISCTNGLLDLSERKLVAHTPALFNLVSVPFDYDPGAAEPTVWLEFLASLWPDDPDSILLLQEYFGYVLSGRTDMHKMLVVVGPFRAGKGTIARIFTRLIGKGNVVGPTLASLGTNFGLSPLLGKPLAIISDARLGSGPSHIVVERLLSITGEDMLTIDRKYREPYTGRLPTRFVMLSNELPRFTDASGAIATRMLILQLTKSFLNREDRTIESRLVPELPGILNWALEGLDRLTANGRFTTPESSEAAATMMMDLASPVSAFVRERCELGPDKTVTRDLLYFDWKVWADSNGHHAGAKITFGRSLHAAVPGLGRVDIPVDDKRVHGYRGIGLLGGPDHRNNNADHPAQPAQDAEPAGQNQSDDQNHSAHRATASFASYEAQEAAHDGAQDEVTQNRTSRPAAQDAHDETQCSSNIGPQRPANPANPERESDRPESDNPSARFDLNASFDALRTELLTKFTAPDHQTPTTNGHVPQLPRQPNRKPEYVYGFCECGDMSGPPLVDKETRLCRACIVKAGI